jgi:hypothetical protein
MQLLSVLLSLHCENAVRHGAVLLTQQYVGFMCAVVLAVHSCQ